MEHHNPKSLNIKGMSISSNAGTTFVSGIMASCGICMSMTGPALPGAAVARTIPQTLTTSNPMGFCGFDSHGIDKVLGPNTRSALTAFRMPLVCRKRDNLTTPPGPPYFRPEAGAYLKGQIVIFFLANLRNQKK